MMKSEEVTRILENAIRIGKGVIRYGSVASDPFFTGKRLGGER